VKGVIVKGFLVWLVPFVIALPLYQLRVSERALFESVMAVTLALTTVFFGLSHMTRMRGVVQALKIGFIWMAISIAIDAVMFSQGPMKMSLPDYMKDIGLTYLMMPVIMVGLVYRRNEK
jgi:hypothetical protein